MTGIDSFAIGQMVGRQLPFLTIIVLFWIMAIMDGWRGIKETAGGDSRRRFVRYCPVPQLELPWPGAAGYHLVAGLHGLSDLFLKRWQPVRIFRFGDLGASQVDMTLARTLRRDK